jgi:hypothetical protein
MVTPGHLNVVGLIVGDTVELLGAVVGASLGAAVGEYVWPETVGPLVLGLEVGEAVVGDSVASTTTLHSPWLLWNIDCTVSPKFLFANVLYSAGGVDMALSADRLAPLSYPTAHTRASSWVLTAWDA